MLNWIVSRIKSADSDHPLGSEKGISAYLAQVPVLNPQSTLQDIGHWFATPEQLAEDLSPENMARAVERLDEFAQDAIRRCWSGYFTENLQDYLSDLALRPLENYYRHTFLAIRHTLARLTGPGRKEADRDQLTRLAIRAMHALVQGKKISHFAYRGPDAEWWRTCHELLFFARNLNILHTKQAIYPEDEQQTSVWREYLVGVLFEVAPLSNLSPPSMEALDCIVRWMEAHCLFIDTFTSQTPFRINLEATDGPQRCAPDQETGPAWRYFGPGPGTSKLIHLRASIQSKREIPEWLQGTQCSAKTCIDLLHLLIQHWSLTPPSRQQERQRLDRPIVVVSGLATARRAIAASEFARSGRTLDYNGHVRILDLHRTEGGARPAEAPPPPKTPMETLEQLESTGIRPVLDEWEALDISASGLGARLPFRRPWQAIGALVAYRFADEIDWRVALIRRLGRSQGRPNAGLTIFDGLPYCAQIQLPKQGEECPWEEQIPETSGLGLLDAILVSRETRLLLAPPGTFAMDQRADLIVGGQRRPVRLAGLQEAGADYELILFRENEA